MSLVLNEDQLMFRDAAKRFAAARAPIAELRRLRDAGDVVGFDRDVWKEMAEMGWAGVLVPEEYGGVGFGHVGAGLIAQEIGRNLSATPFVSTAVLGVTALLKGSEAQKQEWLPKVAAGEAVLALASDECSRHLPFSIATRATGSAGRYKLSGRKLHVLDGHVADRLIVSARTSGDVERRDGITLFL
ncbi:acyl-CoA dehydrogenase family protein, partial [Povalibacter sp.]|uniref:acyl-CoA dehydrogenase family protein n=1 Tax=Povalibacter sp. TaxID=1962978 RepID=UPI002F40AEA4